MPWLTRLSQQTEQTPIEQFRKRILTAVVTVQIGTGKENPW